MDRRIVSQLLTSMDELHQTHSGSGSGSGSSDLGKMSGYVLVITATNRPHSLDPAIRRPERFKREISLGIPDENARKDILFVLIANFTVDGGIDLHRIAKSTSGYVGADLKELVNEAAQVAMERIIDLIKLEVFGETLGNDENGGWWRHLWVPEELENLSIAVTMTDFEVHL